MAKTRERVTDTAGSFRPYVERAFRDEEVRENVKNAIAAARDVYNELIGGRGVTHLATRVATDKEIQENLRNAIEDLRKAADRVQGKEQHKARNTLLLLTGITLGILFNPMTGPSTRRWVKNSLFGESSDDFSYTGNSGYTPPPPTAADTPSTSTFSEPA
jgi:hypothetical protein